MVYFLLYIFVLRQAITQERKRYGFVLERQTSLSKHFLAHYGKGAALLEKHLDGWQETSKAREELPACVEFLLGQQSTVITIAIRGRALVDLTSSNLFPPRR